MYIKINHKDLSIHIFLGRSGRNDFTFLFIIQSKRNIYKFQKKINAEKNHTFYISLIILTKYLVFHNNSSPKKPNK